MRIYKTIDVITNETLRTFPSFIEFAGGDLNDATTITASNVDETPQETLERVHGEINKVLRDDLLNRVYEKSSEYLKSW